MRGYLAVPLLLAPFALSAQSRVVVAQAPTSGSCPVGIEAQHTPQGAVEQVSPSAERHPLGYQISLRAFDARLIRQARVTLEGLDGAQVVPAGEKAGRGEATESFTISPGDAPKATFQTVVYTGKLTGVRWVDVDEVTYADGTQWHQKAGSVCRVAPNGLLLVHAAQ